MNFIIFANARSGSTFLAKTLESTPDVKLSMETFHPKYSEWNPNERGYSKAIKSEEDMKEALQEIVENYDIDNRYYSEILDEKKSEDHIDLFYEEIFSENNKENIKLIQDITSFLEISMPTEDVIAKYMIPNSASVESKKRYKDIPNWDEIKREFEVYIQ